LPACLREDSSMRLELRADRLNQTGAAKDVYSPEFRRTALVALAQRLGDKGEIVLKRPSVTLSGLELRYIAMGLKPLPEGLDAQALAWLADDLATQSKTTAMKGQQVVVDGVEAVVMTSYGLESGMRDFSVDVLAKPSAPKKHTAVVTAPAMTKEQALVVATSSLDGLSKVPDSFRDDPAIVTAAVRHSEFAIQFASPRLLKDKSFAIGLFALTRFPPRMLDATLHDDPEVIGAAFKAWFPRAPESKVNQDFMRYMTHADLRPAMDQQYARDPEFAALRCLFYSNTNSVEVAAGGAPMVYMLDTTPGLASVAAWERVRLMQPLLMHGQLAQDLAALTPEQKSVLSARLAKHDIRCMNRFTSLAQLTACLNAKEAPDARPSVLLMVARSDHNNALRDVVAQTEAAYPGHQVVYVEVSTPEDVLREMAARKSHPASQVFIAGHGGPLGIELSVRAGAAGSITHNIMRSPLVAAAREGIAADAHVVLGSCATGQGARTTANMGNLFSQLLPDRTVHAPTENLHGYPTFTWVAGKPTVEFVMPHQQTQGHVVRSRTKR
jgi:hypothetical protein